ncbi:MAG: Phospholipid N-methyltransferase, partial [uncultured Blastococcus sp.]
ESATGRPAALPACLRRQPPAGRGDPAHVAAGGPRHARHGRRPGCGAGRRARGRHRQPDRGDPGPHGSGRPVGGAGDRSRSRAGAGGAVRRPPAAGRVRLRGEPGGAPGRADRRRAGLRPAVHLAGGRSAAPDPRVAAPGRRRARGGRGDPVLAAHPGGAQTAVPLGAAAVVADQRAPGVALRLLPRRRL